MNYKNVKYNKNKKSNKDKILMTIIIGIKCKDGIVIGSDSQATDSYFRFKKVDYDKIYEHSNKIGDNFYNLAGAGDPDYIEKTNLEIFMKFYESKISYFDFGNICEDAVNVICQKYIVGRAKELGLLNISENHIPNLPDWQEQFDNLGFSIVTGTIINKGVAAISELYLVDLRGIAKKIETYCITGSGFLFAEYVLSRLYKKDINIIEAMNIIIYVIEEVKKHDPNCGGEVKISALSNTLGFMPADLKNDIVPDAAKYLQNIDNNMKKVWQDFIINPAKKFKELEEEKQKIGENGKES